MKHTQMVSPAGNQGDPGLTSVSYTHSAQPEVGSSTTEKVSMATNDSSFFGLFQCLASVLFQFLVLLCFYAPRAQQAESRDTEHHGHRWQKVRGALTLVVDSGPFLLLTVEQLIATDIHSHATSLLGFSHMHHCQK